MNHRRVPPNLRYRGPIDNEDIDYRTLLIAALSAVGAMTIATATFAAMWWLISIIS